MHRTAFAAALFVVFTAPALAQDPPIPIYRREVFDYSAQGRRDPFRSLVNSDDLGVRVEDLTLRGVVVSRDARRSVATLEQVGSERRIRARVGDRIGGITVVAILPRSVEVVVEEFGVPRREVLPLKRSTNPGAGS